MKKIIIFILVALPLFALDLEKIQQAGNSTTPITTKRFLHTGFYFDAVLKNAIVSYNIESPVIAETEYDIVYLKNVVVPKGTKIIGYASIFHSEDRVVVSFHTLVFPDGTEVKFQGMGLHTDGSAGIPGEVKKATYKVPVNIILGAAGSLIPGIGGEVAKGLAGETKKQMEQYVPETIITIKKDTAILIYNIQRVEY